MTAPHGAEHAAQLVNHWYWRPGWRAGRTFYTWHLTFDGQHELHQLVTTYQHALRQLPGLDLVPLPWLHITMQGIGFTDEVPDDQLYAIADAVSVRLAEVSAPLLRFHHLTARTQALALYPQPDAPVHAIRDAIRHGIADVWGHVPEAHADYQPHLSIAYVNTDGPSAPILGVLADVHPEPAGATVRAASLIALERHGHLYRWRTSYTVPLGS